MEGEGSWKEEMYVSENRQVRGETRTLEVTDGPTPKPEIHIPLNFENI